MVWDFGEGLEIYIEVYVCLYEPLAHVGASCS